MLANLSNINIILAGRNLQELVVKDATSCIMHTTSGIISASHWGV